MMVSEVSLRRIEQLLSESPASCAPHSQNAIRR